MKKWSLLSVLLFAVAVSAAVDLPKSIAIKVGDVDLRLDAAKRWCINSIKVKGNVFGIDNPGSHYGMVYFGQGAKGFIGSGHTETGAGEVVESVTFIIDGKECPPAEKMTAAKEFVMSKVSTIGDLSVTYTFSLKDRTLFERTSITAKKDVPVKVAYCFMHPWSPKFTTFCGLRPSGEMFSLTLVSNEKFPSQGFLPKIAMFNPETGDALATAVTVEYGFDKLSRLMWDRKIYHKDYIVVAGNQVIPAGRKGEISAKTVFFRSTAEKFTADAEKCFMQL